MGGLQLPARIGKYELEEFLGGGMSHVYRARDTVIGRTVALKILTEQGNADPETRARFLREAQMAGSLSHDNVLAVYDFGEEQGRPFMVMEFLRGEDLRHAIQNGHTGELPDRLKLALQIARGLEHIHEHSIVHRDIKPENIHVSTSGTVKLMDFGIAKTQDMTLTRAGFTLGTPYYMPPEQVLGKEVTYLADVYAFGVLLFELLTGSKPITAETVEALFYRILHEPLDLEPLQQAGAPAPLIDLVRRCTQKNPAERVQSFNEVGRELERILTEMTAPPPAVVPEPTTPKARPVWLMPSIVVAALVTLSLVGYFALRTGREEAPPVQPPKPMESKPAAAAMVEVPAGAFLYGPDKRRIELPAFSIDRTEVTNQAYDRFCRETQRSLPPGFPSDRPQDPVVNVTIEDARAYARWAGKRLPTAQEWEKAARGADGWLYPWGNDRSATRAVVADNPELPAQAVAPALSFPQGASPYGALHMAGNVWEWVETREQPPADVVKSLAKALSPPPTADEPWFVIRGASFKLALAPIYEHALAPARFRAGDIGFRCVK